MAEPGQSLVAQAARAAAANGTNMADELIRLEKQRRISEEISQSKSQEGRKAAEKAAKTTVQEGVKKTTYPYVAPSRGGGGGGGRGGAMTGIGGGGGVPGIDEMLAKGGKVKSYASGGSVRGGGCEQRGKTKGRFV
jgi:hypothetical protein